MNSEKHIWVAREVLNLCVKTIKAVRKGARCIPLCGTDTRVQSSQLCLLKVEKNSKDVSIPVAVEKKIRLGSFKNIIVDLLVCLDFAD